MVKLNFWYCVMNTGIPFQKFLEKLQKRSEDEFFFKNPGGSQTADAVLRILE